MQHGKLDKKLDQSVRPVTGPMQFGDDWPGIFIRGDEALALASIIQRANELQRPMPTNDGSLLDGLAKTLLACHVK